MVVRLCFNKGKVRVCVFILLRIEEINLLLGIMECIKFFVGLVNCFKGFLILIWLDKWMYVFDVFKDGY